MEMYAKAICQYGAPSFQINSIQRNARNRKTYPKSNVKRAPRASTSFADRGATTTMTSAAGRIAAPASSVEYPRTF